MNDKPVPDHCEVCGITVEKVPFQRLQKCGLCHKYHCYDCFIPVHNVCKACFKEMKEGTNWRAHERYRKNYAEWEEGEQRWKIFTGWQNIFSTAFFFVITLFLAYIALRGGDRKSSVVGGGTTIDPVETFFIIVEVLIGLGFLISVILGQDKSQE